MHIDELAVIRGKQHCPDGGLKVARMRVRVGCDDKARATVSAKKEWATVKRRHALGRLAQPSPTATARDRTGGQGEPSETDGVFIDLRVAAYGSDRIVDVVAELKDIAQMGDDEDFLDCGG